MDNLPTSFSFKENVLVPCVVSSFFGLAAAVITLACLLKVTDNPVWLVPGLAAAALTFVLFRFAVNSLRYRQIITISPQNIASRSLARGVVEIPWYNIENIAEEEFKGENLRRAMPGLETILAMYMNLPLTGGAFRKSLIVIKGSANREISIRSHMLYPHRLEQLRHALTRYAPNAGPGSRLLRLNINN